MKIRQAKKIMKSGGGVGARDRARRKVASYEAHANRARRAAK